MGNKISAMDAKGKHPPATPTEELKEGVLSGDCQRVKTALDKGANTKIAVSTTRNDTWCLICLAAELGHSEVIYHLLVAGMDVDGSGTAPETPLMLAARGGHILAVRQLLMADANPHARDAKGRVALHYAAWEGHNSCVTELLIRTNRLHKDMDGLTAAHCASHGNHIYILKILKAAEFDLEAGDNDGDTALHIAAYNGSLKAAQFLLDAGLSPTLKNHSGLTPTQLALSKSHTEVVEWLSHCTSMPQYTTQQQDLLNNGIPLVG